MLRECERLLCKLYKSYRKMPCTAATGRENVFVERGRQSTPATHPARETKVCDLGSDVAILYCCAQLTVAAKRAMLCCGMLVVSHRELHMHVSFRREPSIVHSNT